MHTGKTFFATGLTLLVGVLVWFGLCWRQRKHLTSTRSIIAAILVTGLAVRLAYVFFTPIFYAPDEQPHFNYIKHLAETKSFPVQVSKLGDASNDWEYNQPPLYYIASVPCFAAVHAMFHDQGITVIALRLFSVALWALNAWLVIALLRRLNIKDDFTRIFVVAMVSLLPTYTFVSSVINNDNLLATLGSGMLCLLAERNRSFNTSLALGLLLGLGLLTKQSAVIFAPLIIALVSLEVFNGKIATRSAAQQLTVIFGIAGLIYLPWAARNWQVYHTFLPENLVVTKIPWPSAIQGLASAGHNLLKTFWAVSGLSNDVGYPFPLVGMLLLGLPVVVFALDSKPVVKTDSLNVGENRLIYVAMLVAITIATALVLRFGFQFGMGQGRHLFPLLTPIALLLAAWLRRLPIKHIEIHAAGFWMTYVASFAAFSLCRFP